MTTMHTPGPWEIDTDTRPVEVCTIHGVPPQGEEGQKWIYVRGAIGDWDATEETNLANARLIAAAPELLAALEVVVADWTAQFERAGHLAPSWCKQAREAITKATAP